ncbi:hypothetical protein GCM10027598_71620 [Amycolatopsis oliviviridis]|uniref:histidine kinase n=1 Tax=Amycolatopsis oliviviridis TaxID=1471590 RepID=A0ABQ3L479_9PSEU|nr:sensor histidine kinase [Amycolatopsis oliviviridis]GHH01522.1 hypothetical protein GCM10017790_01560 [Amycolatopsis oliviviridis]
MTIANLRFAPAILQRLGEELVPHPDLGVMELIRNAYDADAETCTVELQHADASGGRVVISDTGDGMRSNEIRDGWLLLGKSPKAESTLSRTGRRKVGEKGLGRLAALRLGRHVVLTTRPREEPGTEYVLKIDWEDFASAETVEDVGLTIERHSTTAEPGTVIEILDLRTGFSSRDIDRLARSVVLLTGPFDGPDEFTVTLDAPKFRDLERLVHDKYFDECEYQILATLDEDGLASAQLVDWRGKEIASADHSEISSSGFGRNNQPIPRYFAPAATFELWTFNLSKKDFTIRNSRRAVREVANWLKVVGGVHLYHRGLRVHPYGDEGHDWLDMNLRRARSPELRPSTNTAIGRISVQDEENQLTPKTDRMGFLENYSFMDLREFGRNVLDWAATRRLQVREDRRTQEKQDAESRASQAWSNVQDLIKNISPAERKALQSATSELRRAYDEKVYTIEQDLLLYRTLATVGTTTAVFAHETKRPVGQIISAAQVVERRAKSLIEDAVFDSRLAKQIAAITTAATSLSTFADIPLRLLESQKRKSQTLDINPIISDVISIFQPHLDQANIIISLEQASAGAPVVTMVALIEAIVANLLANAVYAFTRPNDLADAQRTILVVTEDSEEVVTMRILDNGPGIDTVQLPVKDIWLPGKTTREDGTGLGLTIVRDIVQDMDGEVEALASSRLGGAEFVIRLPRAMSR